MYQYIAFPQNYEEEGDFFYSYGIKIMEEKTVIKTVSYISFSKRDVLRFADMCTRLQVSPVNFDDVLEDFLSG